MYEMIHKNFDHVSIEIKCKNRRLLANNHYLIAYIKLPKLW